MRFEQYRKKFGEQFLQLGFFRRVWRWPARGLRQLEHQQRHLHAHSRGLNQVRKSYNTDPWSSGEGKHILPLYLRGDFFGFSYNFGQIKLSQSSILRNLFSAWDPTLEQSACPPAWKSKFRSSWSWSWSSLWPGTPRAPSAPFPDGEPPLRVEASPVFSRRSFEDLMTWHEDMITWCKSIC